MSLTKEENEIWIQSNLWKDHPWHDAPAKVKVETKKGLCHMNIELTLGYFPEVVHDLLCNPHNLPFYRDKKRGHHIMKNKSRKVLKEDGPKKIVESEKAVFWEFLSWRGYLPVTLIIDENGKDLTGKYKKEKMKFMKVFEGNWKVEPLFVDSERLCKHMLPKNQEEYSKCSGGHGKIASKLIIDQYFQPYPLFNLPPVSWYIRETTINTTKTLIKLLQDMVGTMRAGKLHKY